MRLFIAEKPSLAKAIFEGLGGNPIRKRKTAILNMVLMSLPGVMVICWSFTTRRIMTKNIPTGV
jgi:DNA topoisomerase-3